LAERKLRASQQETETNKANPDLTEGDFRIQTLTP
jgi:hypothetical protein